MTPTEPHQLTVEMPEKCPQCRLRAPNGSALFWRKHYQEHCDPLGALYTFALPGVTEVRA